MNAGPISEHDLQAYVDGRLAPARAAQLESWLADHPDEAARIAALRQDRDTLRAAYAPFAAEPVPARLVAEFQRGPRQAWRRAAAAVLIFAAGAAAGWAGGVLAQPSPPAARDLVRNAIGAHRVFVPEVRHPVEVGAREEAHLVQWLSKRVGHALAAPDLTASGFRLVGGRLLSEGARPAALFMYENAAGQRITIHCIPDPGGTTTAFRYREIAGVSAFYWIDEKLAYAVIGTVQRDKLLEIARATYAALEKK
ncbi:MAG: anti-sigma factor [Rhodospirillaceae bacterium]|nr:anti-sigma factor [Rhodospirillaceae bacterium]